MSDHANGLPYPPPWQDIGTLAKHICAATTTVENWVASGILPPPRKRGGKLMWKWSEVDAWLTEGRKDGQPNLATEIRDGVRKEREADRNARL